MVEMDCTRTDRGFESDLSDKVATSKHARGSPTLSTPHRQERKWLLEI